MSQLLLVYLYWTARANGFQRHGAYYFPFMMYLPTSDNGAELANRLPRFLNDAGKNLLDALYV